MFTGIITEVGRVRQVSSDRAGRRLCITAPRTSRGLKRGGSIAVDGVCLTVLSVRRGQFTAQVVPETLRRSILEGIEIGARVNLERPLRPAGELSGHFVQGHVDARARVVGLRRVGKEVILKVELPSPVRGLIVEKGSVAINGVSLTVAAVAANRFEVALIPHTLAQTNLGELEPDDEVNLEVDILAKYVRSLVSIRAPKGAGARTRRSRRS